MALTILGDGQLARFIRIACENLGVPCSVVTFDRNQSAVFDIKDPTFGDIEDSDFLKSILIPSRNIVFENEFVNLKKLRPFEENTHFVPSLDCIEILQNKFEQKKLANRLQIPTAPFEKISLEQLTHTAPPYVLKWDFMGYDGKGVLIVKNSTDSLQLEKFFADAAKNGAGIFKEEYVPYDVELALVSICDSKQSVSYPLFQTVQENGICSEVYIPPRSTINADINELAKGYALKFSQEMKLKGAFAIEFFYSQDRGLMLNEIAPRVHNSGHITMDSHICSQFENHVRAVEGFGLIMEAKTSSPFCSMLNIIGKKTSDAVSPNNVAGAKLYWYHKTKTQLGRKMGHYNICAASAEELEDTLSRVRKEIQEWQKI